MKPFTESYLLLTTSYKGINKVQVIFPVMIKLLLVTVMVAKAVVSRVKYLKKIFDIV